jgi:N-methylhydantoinase A
MASYIIGVDTGGTFTDITCCDDGGRTITYKTPSTPPNFNEGVINAVRGVAEILGLSVGELLNHCISFVHGSTVVVNTVLTRSGSKNALFTTKGNRDVLHIAGGSWGKTLNIGWDEFRHIGMIDKPEPLIPKSLIKEIDERIDYSGEVIVPLDREESARALRELVQEGINSIAVSFLWSFRNPSHERSFKEIALGIKPDMEVSLSSDIAPYIGEYVRTCTTTFNAYTVHAFKKYVRTLVSDLRALGYSMPVLVMESTGGCEPASLVQETPVYTVGSGPVGGLIGSQHLGNLLGYKQLVCTDMGGTSFEVGLIVDGSPVTKTESFVERFPLYISALDVHSIGAGGGSVVWVDEFGVMKVGPKSAGAMPGPACYGLGGEEPTVTDADVILGYIDTNYFLGGKMKLSKEKSQRAFEKVAHQLSMDIVHGAAGACQIVDAQMADLIRKKTVGLGLDPRDFVVLAYGGAGPLHGSGYSGELGVSKLVIPLGNIASCYSAFGLTAADMKHIEARSEPEKEPFNSKKIRSLMEELDQRCINVLKEEGVREEDIQLVRSMDMKFTGQIWEVEVPLPDDISDDIGAELPALFSKRYNELFGVGAAEFRGTGCEVITCRVMAIGKRMKPTIRKLLKPAEGKNLVKGTRQAFWFELKCFSETPVYDGNLLGHGKVIAGPAIIEMPHTTILVHPGDQSEVDAYGNIFIDLRR